LGSWDAVDSQECGERKESIRRTDKSKSGHTAPFESGT
jgi:hypothetical protein